MNGNRMSLNVAQSGGFWKAFFHGIRALNRTKIAVIESTVFIRNTLLPEFFNVPSTVH